MIWRLRRLHVRAVHFDGDLDAERLAGKMFSSARSPVGSRGVDHESGAEDG